MWSKVVFPSFLLHVDIQSPLRHVWKRLLLVSETRFHAAYSCRGARCASRTSEMLTAASGSRGPARRAPPPPAWRLRGPSLAAVTW